ncbi:unnamed protein product [Caenorhabditis sp. 36 PRJEB53466]|nr:unnamed protein product [Caenorhabditis sp. 36 PRJEB53466]
MEGQSEEIQKKKARTKTGCDVGCQTDHQQPSNSSSSQNQQNGTSAAASANSSTTTSSQPSGTTPASAATMAAATATAAVNGALKQLDKATGEAITNNTSGSTSSSSTPGSATPAEVSTAPLSPASSVNTATQAVQSATNPIAAAPAVPPGQTLSAQSKARCASTNGVVGEAKKQVRNSQPAPPTATAASSSSASTNGTAKGDGPSWSDENCKLRLVISRFSHLEETMCSPPKSIEGVSWKIMVMPKQHMVQKKQQKCMGFFLQCAPERAYSDQWSVHAIADMRMISYKPNVPHFARRTTHTYTSKENDWGYSCFMTWADIIDEAQGYIRDDTVVLEIAVKADPPKNMMTHEDFLDKIEKWIVLADMQMKKNNIDLALEANQSAMKFCKGKDDVCYQRLETQRETFVNAKLFESIERIEKGPVVCTDTTHGKPTSLRQALTGAQKSLNGKMTAKGGKKTRAVVTVQHMKKKKPYDQNNTNAQRTNSGPTVKDLVEKKKNGKSDEQLKKELVKSVEDVEIDEQTDSSDESQSQEEKVSVGSGEEEFDVDDEYNEGDYADQADEMNDELGPSNSGPLNDEDDEDDSCSDEDEAAIRREERRKATEVMLALRHFGTEPVPFYQGSCGELGCVDRYVQTDDTENGHPQMGDAESLIIGQLPQMVYEDRLLANTVLRTFIGEDESNASVGLKTFYSKMGIQAAPEDPIEKVFGVEGIEQETSFTKGILDNLPPVMRVGKDGAAICSLSMAEKMIRSWLDVEGALLGSIDPDGVIAKLSEDDRKELVDELSFKINPLIVTLDLEFRETVHDARSFLMSTRNTLEESQKVTLECEDMKKTFEEKMNNGTLKDASYAKRTGAAVYDGKTKTATSAAATSNSNANAGGTNRRPTVIAKRSMKPVILDGEGDENRGKVADFIRCVDSIPIQPIQDDGHNMRDVHIAFRRLNQTMTPMIHSITTNNRKLQKMFADMVGADGMIGKYIKDLIEAHTQSKSNYGKEISTLKESLSAATTEKNDLLLRVAEQAKAITAETDKNTKLQKDLTNVKSQLKKAESKATKEENRATALQVQLNDLDEKTKALRKELETLKKKSADERAKSKKEKERDTQTMRQQSIEISERENERDKARKEVEELNRGKDKLEKEKKAVATQLAAMTERARAAEAAVMESRWNSASQELQKRKDAVQNGYTETEGLANRVRQVADRDIMRKSLGEWKAALDKCDAQTKSVKADFDHAAEQIKNGVKTLVQILEIKIPAADPLPKLVKPPPVQVVAPSASVIPPPIIPPTPAAGVIGQQRTPIGRQVSTNEAPSACSTPSRQQRVTRVPSPVSVKSASDAPSSLWSWNTIGTIGELRPASVNESYNSSMDSLQRDIWAANGNGNGSLGSDYLRNQQASIGAMTNSTGSPASPYNRQPGNNQQMQQGYANQQNQQQQMQNNQRMQQQRGYGDLWTGAANMQQNGQQDYGNARMMSHNGSGDLSNGQGYAPWHQPQQQQPPIGQQMRGGAPQQQQAGGHHNMFQSHSFFD